MRGFVFVAGQVMVLVLELVLVLVLVRLGFLCSGGMHYALWHEALGDCFYNETMRLRRTGAGDSA